MAELHPTDVARLREKAEQLNRAASHELTKLTPHSVTLVQELRVHQIELELQCQELQRAHVESEESRNRYRELYESIPLGYITIDSEGKIFDLNPAGASLLGIGVERRLHNFFSFFSQGDGDAALLLCRRVLADHEAAVCDLNMKQADGTDFLAALQVAPVQSGDGKGTRLRIAFKDITQRKKVEETLRQHQVELENNRIELQDLMAKLFTAQEEERRRIACDLHDDHCQRITALILEATAMEKLVKVVMPSMRPRLAAFKAKLSEILDDFRHLTHELHPRHLDTVSLACSMRTHIKEFIEYTDLRVEFSERDVPAHLPMPITICLYRLLQESLGNIRKHANAKHVTVQLSGGNQEVELLVSDDGAGFNCIGNGKGLGLTSMQERVRPLRGQVTINSKLGAGTSISVKIPLRSGG
ncbi:MAG: putative Histidine kinase [Nitrospira sp.]|nr:putative Histidine kinase [Nitrospira sp.]